MVMLIWSLAKKDAGSNTVVKPIFVEIQFCGFYLESIHEIKVLIKAESYDNRWYFWDHCQQIFISLNYKFRKIDAHKYKWNHSTSEGAWFFSSHSWAIKPSISMYLNHPRNVKPLWDWVRYTSEYYKPSRTCERN